MIIDNTYNIPQIWVEKQFSPIVEIQHRSRVDEVQPLEISERRVEGVGWHDTAGVRVFRSGDAVSTASITYTGNFEEDIFKMQLILLP